MKLFTKANKQGRIKILIGPNGWGKTNILEMIKTAFSQNYYHYLKKDFESIKFDFSNSTSIVFRKSKNSIYLDYINTKGKRVSSPVISEKDFFETRKKARHGRDPNDTRFQRLAYIATDIISDEFEVKPTPRGLLIEDEFHPWSSVLDNYGHLLPKSIVRDLCEMDPHKSIGIPKPAMNLLRSTKIKFIETQRLLIEIPKSKRDMHSSTSFYPSEENDVDLKRKVNQISRDLLRKIEKQARNSNVKSQELEKSFPVRLLDEISKRRRESYSIDIPELENELKNLQKTRMEFENAGILEPTQEIFDQEIDINEEIAAVFKVYVDDVRSRFEYFTELYSKINLFKRIINFQFSHKRIQISRKKGIQFVSTTILRPLDDNIQIESSGEDESNKKMIGVKSLSSGEQHLLVLFYDLIFNVKRGTLILIDEPEISLHVAWQKEFVSWLNQIADLNDLRVIIATHSPQIIGKNINLTVDLVEARLL